MIKVIKDNKVRFTGKDKKDFLKIAKDLGLSPQDTLTGMLWELIMREARNGKFKKGKKTVVA